MKNKLLIITSVALFFIIPLYAGDIEDSIIVTKHNKNLTIKDIAEIQPGLGTVMMEFGHRFHIIYYAAKANNWKLAQYELKELVEAQEIAETTRPKYKKQLKEFEDNYLKILQDSIDAENWKKFEKQYSKVTNACNTCHEMNGHPYIKYELPIEEPKYLRMYL